MDDECGAGEEEWNDGRGAMRSLMTRVGQEKGNGIGEEVL